MEKLRVLHPISPRVRHRVRTALGVTIGLIGLANMVSAIVPGLQWTALFGAWILAIHHPAHGLGLTVTIGFFLVMLSYGLIRGKLQAWRMTLALLLLSATLHLLFRDAAFATVLALVLATLLIIFSRCFRAKSDPPAVRRGYITLLFGLCLVVFYAIGGFIAFYNQLDFLIERLGIETVLVDLLTHARFHMSASIQVYIFGRTLSLLCITAVLYGMLLILRPVAASLLPDQKKKHSVESLTRLYGKNSISYFALSEDKSFFFSASGKAFLSYVLEGSVAVVAGDPIGPEAELPLMLQQFVAFCREQDWSIVFWQVRDALVPFYKAEGLHLLKMGEDAIVDLGSFTLKGGSMANVRASAKRAEKEGLRVVFYPGYVSDSEQLAQMESISRAWVSRKGGSEMGFSMGRFDPRGDEAQICALAVDGANKVHAFATFIPIYGRNGWGLDLMRRAEQAAPGAMELLLARSMEYMKSKGADMVSLGLATLSNVQHEDETLLDSSIDFLMGRLGNPGKNSSLFNFKKKFCPAWESRYLVYSTTLKLPKIGLALYHAHQRDLSLLSMARRIAQEWWQAQNKRLASRLVPAAGS